MSRSLAKCSLPRHGARSPSGNARGGCRGCTPFRLGQTPSKKNDRDNIKSFAFVFWNSQPKFPPNFKKISLGFCESFSQKIASQNRVHRIGTRTPSVSPLEKPALNTTPNNTLCGGEGGTTERERNREHIPCARWSGRYGVTEFVVERTITFQTTIRSAREIRFNDKFLLKWVLASFKRDSNYIYLLLYIYAKRRKT